LSAAKSEVCPAASHGFATGADPDFAALNPGYGFTSDRTPRPADQISRSPFRLDDDVVVHGDTERLRHIDDLLGHLDIGA
jgi:hypothetical protein